jgi:hypothetical protein
MAPDPRRRLGWRSDCVYWRNYRGGVAEFLHFSKELISNVGGERCQPEAGGHGKRRSLELGNRRFGHRSACFSRIKQLPSRWGGYGTLNLFSKLKSWCAMRWVKSHC